MAKKKTLTEKRYTSDNNHGAASKFGQLIGEAFEKQVEHLIETYLAQHHPDYALRKPDQGKKQIKLEMLGGTGRQMDNVIGHVGSDDPVALLETKWLKDARHHNDKGAWILQLREVRKKYATLRGAIANLAGYWNGGVGVVFEREGDVRMVHVATDSDVYSTFQPYLDSYCEQYGLDRLVLVAAEIRKSLPRAHDLANFLVALKNDSLLDEIAARWLSFHRKDSEDGMPLEGKDLIYQAIDELLKPLPEAPDIRSFEITLNIETGNMIHAKFQDFEEARQFLEWYHKNPQAILDKIQPRPSQSSEDNDEANSITPDML